MSTPQPIDESPMLFVCGMSRSGTTLLATIFEAHSRITMGYELIPPPQLPRPAALREALEQGLELSGGDFEACGPALRRNGEKGLGLFFTRCLRAGLDVDQTRQVLDEVQAAGITSFERIEDRLRTAWSIIRRRHVAEASDLFGFKLNNPSYDRSQSLFPGGHFVYILRHPLDVVASQRRQGFDHTLEEVCRAWNGHLAKFSALASRLPERARIIRYEDLVHAPRTTLERIFSSLPVELEEGLFEFHRSEGPVYRSRHPNVDNLRKGFFTDSVARGARELGATERRQVEDHCGEAMRRYGYRDDRAEDSPGVSDPISRA